MKILALGAHPDDVEIYMFGTLAAAKASGAEVEIAIATDGAAGGRGDPAVLRETRRKEAMAAAKLLGVEPHLLDFADGAFIADAASIAAIKALIGRVAPDLVLTHAPNDYHGDHRALSESVRIGANFQVPVLWADTMMGAGFSPTHYVEITAHIEAKAEAIRAHVSQDPERLVTMSLDLSRHRAAQANSAPGSHAEAFRFEPVYPFVDVRDLLPPAPPVRPVGDRRNNHTRE
jgi:LmbE family N-acetylglucosaminyl deacetylase